MKRSNIIPHAGLCADQRGHSSKTFFARMEVRPAAALRIKKWLKTLVYPSDRFVMPWLTWKMREYW